MNAKAYSACCGCIYYHQSVQVRGSHLRWKERLLSKFLCSIWKESISVQYLMVVCACARTRIALFLLYFIINNGLYQLWLLIIFVICILSHFVGFLFVWSNTKTETLMCPLRNHQGIVALSTRNVHFDHGDTPNETNFRF